MLRTKLPVAVSCPVVWSHAPLSVCSAGVPSPLLRMPQTNKSTNFPAADSLGSVPSGASAEEPVSLEENQAAGEGGGGEGGEREENIGDSEIIKSPSDPKKYR